ncbi:bone morphogenetic protein receptor type-2 isoform X3 [Gasterosteus aculeatus]
MAAVGGALLTVRLCFLLLPAVSGLQEEDRHCAFTDKLQGVEPFSGPANELRGAVQDNGTVHCVPGSRCYGLWEKRADGEMHLVKQGCWTRIGNQQECHGDRCLVTATPSQVQNGSYRFCCCSRDLCNGNFTEAPPTADTPALRLLKADGQSDRQTERERQEETALIALVIGAIAAVVIVVLFLGYRTMKVHLFVYSGKQKLGLSALDVMEAANTHGAVDLDHLQLLELIGRGRYGTVFRGSLNERCIAVKLFSSAHRHNFCNERSIHGLPLLQHPHLAGFLGAEERAAADGRPEFLILMEFYPQGCLSGFLSHHTVDWSTCCRMTHGVTRGLAFLHTELYKGDQYKPAVAHRDVTSRNVLVRSDLSCVLADFGLSMRLTGSRPCHHGDEDTVAISEVGTVRYMAPEVLGGALNLRDCESALKQVDVYALGLLYWESFRRCSHLFPGDPVPEYQLAFQEELGNHPSFEEMQILVGKEKFRPKFPEAWKDNSLALRSLKETMEDCWDQDAEARLTAQCAEERLCDLTLLTTHSLVHNQRNRSQVRWPSPVGAASTDIEDLNVGVANNLLGDGNTAAVVKTTMSAAEGCENRNAINYERLQAQTRSSTSDIYMFSNTTLTPASNLCSIFEPGVPGSKVLVHLSEEDLEAVKLKPEEVRKNLREGSDEILMEHSQKQFGPTEQETHSLSHNQVNSVLDLQGEHGVVGWLDSPPSSFQPFSKQQNPPHRPTSLQLLPRTSDASSRLNLGKLKSYHRQVETGVAKMNTVMVAMPVAPIQVTTVTKNISARGALSPNGRVYSKVDQNSYSASVPTLVTSGMTGEGQTNQAGPQLEEEEKMEDQMVGCDNLNLLNSLDEHKPLLKREHPLAERELLLLPFHHRHHQSQMGIIGSGQGSNSNNNNNSAVPASNVTIQGLKVTHKKMIGSEVHQGPEPELRPASQQMSESPVSADLDPTAKDRGLDAFPCVQTACFAQPAPSPGSSRSPEAHLVRSITTALVPDRRNQDSCSAPVPAPEGPGSPVSQDPNTSSSTALFLNALTHGPKLQALRPPVLHLEAPVVNPKASVFEVKFPKPAAPHSPVSDPETPGVLRIQMGKARAKRPERPLSLDLSCISSDDGSLNSSGEKIKRRVKTPYTLKKWRPASWFVSTDTALETDFEFYHLPSGPHGAGSLPKINQSKSSMAVFLVGGGGTACTATTTSEPDGMTRF